MTASCSLLKCFTLVSNFLNKKPKIANKISNFLWITI